MRLAAKQPYGFTAMRKKISVSCRYLRVAVLTRRRNQMSVKVEATLELLTLAHEVVLLRKERAEATVLMEQAADDLERLKAENARLQAGGCALPSDGRAEGLVKASELFALSADRDRLTAEVERLKGIEELYKAGCAAWNPVYKVVLDERDALRAENARLKADLDVAQTHSVQGAMRTAALVDEHDHEVHLGVVRRDRVRDLLQHDRLEIGRAHV
jgi:hypothetical protein